MNPIRFDGRVAVITGAGAGLGRAHALLLAARGARVVVNDLGDGADKVVAEIRAAGGQALAHQGSVADPAQAGALVATALDAWGRVDVLINNAGMLRDKSLAKIAPEDFASVLAVHLQGSAWCSQAALDAMQAQGYGRIVMTSSAAGLYGNFGQCNYAAAKLGLVGLMNALKLEGRKYGILVNTIAPVALTQMTAGLPFAALLADAAPEHVSAAVAWLASEDCTLSGEILACGAGYFARVQVVESQGVQMPVDQVSPEAVAAQWPQIADMAGARPFDSATAALSAVFGRRG